MASNEELNDSMEIFDYLNTLQDLFIFLHRLDAINTRTNIYDDGVEWGMYVRKMTGTKQWLA